MIIEYIVIIMIGFLFFSSIAIVFLILSDERKRLKELEKPLWERCYFTEEGWWMLSDESRVFLARLDNFRYYRGKANPGISPYGVIKNFNEK